MQHVDIDPEQMAGAFVYSKGFGGNNATATVIAPHVVERLLAARHGARAMRNWRQRVEGTRERSAAYDRAASGGSAHVIYRFDHDVRGDEQVQVTAEAVRVDGVALPVSLDLANPFD